MSKRQTKRTAIKYTSNIAHSHKFDSMPQSKAARAHIFVLKTTTQLLSQYTFAHSQNGELTHELAFEFIIIFGGATNRTSSSFGLIQWLSWQLDRWLFGTVALAFQHTAIFFKRITTAVTAATKSTENNNKKMNTKQNTHKTRTE